jgi:hypothetical protein
MLLTMRDRMVSKNGMRTLFKGPRAFAGHGIPEYIKTSSLMYRKLAKHWTRGLNFFAT